MTELTLKQKNSYIDYAIEDMLESDEYEFLCVSYDDWYRENIKKYKGKFNNNLILQFPELVQIIVKRLKIQKVKEYDLNEETFCLGAIDVVHELTYRIKLLRRLKKEINSNLAIKEKKYGKD